MADTIITVRATLPYALRHPDCTPTSQEDLMRMAARRIDELEVALEEKTSIMQSNLSAQEGLLQKHEVLERTCELLSEAVNMYESYALLAQPVDGFNAGQWVNEARATLAKVQEMA